MRSDSSHFLSLIDSRRARAALRSLEARSGSGETESWVPGNSASSSAKFSGVAGEIIIPPGKDSGLERGVTCVFLR